MVKDGCGHIDCTGYPGLRDPCGGGDAAASMTAQERADLTLSAQVSYACTCMYNECIMNVFLIVYSDIFL